MTALLAVTSLTGCVWNRPGLFSRCNSDDCEPACNDGCNDNCRDGSCRVWRDLADIAGLRQLIENVTRICPVGVDPAEQAAPPPATGGVDRQHRHLGLREHRRHQAGGVTARGPAAGWQQDAARPQQLRRLLYRLALESLLLLPGHVPS